MEPKNREQRRHPEKDEQPHDEVPKHAPVDDMLSARRTPDDLSVRAKSTGHGKKTADKWNQ
jgi:hypothetical protein